MAHAISIEAVKGFPLLANYHHYIPSFGVLGSRLLRAGTLMLLADLGQPGMSLRIKRMRTEVSDKETTRSYLEMEPTATRDVTMNQNLQDEVVTALKNAYSFGHEFVNRALEHVKVDPANFELPQDSQTLQDLLSCLRPRDSSKFSFGKKPHLLGEGQFAKVYLAKHKCTQTLVAIKGQQIQKDKLQQNPFTEERQVVEKLQSLKLDHVITMYWEFQSPRHQYFVMPVVEKTLETYLREHLMKTDKDPEWTSKLQSWIPQIAQGLSNLHKNDIVHRDIKLDNIMIEKKTLDVKIIDFGLSHQTTAECAQSNGCERCQMVCGSEIYYSPDMANAELGKTEGVDRVPWTDDAWAFGVMMFLLISGRLEPPFFNKADAKALGQSERDAVLQRMYENIAQKPVETDSLQVCGEVLGKLLEKDKLRRVEHFVDKTQEKAELDLYAKGTVVEFWQNVKEQASACLSLDPGSLANSKDTSSNGS